MKTTTYAILKRAAALIAISHEPPKKETRTDFTYRSGRILGLLEAATEAATVGGVYAPTVEEARKAAERIAIDLELFEPRGVFRADEIEGGRLYDWSKPSELETLLSEMEPDE